MGSALTVASAVRVQKVDRSVYVMSDVPGPETPVSTPLEGSIVANAVVPLDQAPLPTMPSCSVSEDPTQSDNVPVIGAGIGNTVAAAVV